jgi:Uma2 family endonuclease
MSSAALTTRYTPEEYLALERKAEHKSEYLNGFITAMSGTSYEHGLIGANLIGEIRSQLKDGPCDVVTSDVRVLVSETGLYTYPDVTVVCGRPLFLDKVFDTLLNPTVLIEILSPSTEAYDRGDKFAHYRHVESLREYVLVSQDKMRLERYTKQGEDWLMTASQGPEAFLELQSIGCKVALAEIYRKVVFSEPPAATI